MGLIKERLGLEAVRTAGKTGQFDVMVDGERIAKRGGNWVSRSFGAGYPELDSVVELLVEKKKANAAR